MKNPVTILRLVFGAVAVVLCGVAWLLHHDTSSFIASASRTQGEVMRLLYVESSKRNESGTWKPLVSFKAPSGEIIEFAPSSSSSPPSYEVGETVNVFFDPENPQDARLDGFFSLWGGATITGGLGLVFLLLTAGLLFVPASAPAKRRRPR